MRHLELMLFPARWRLPSFRNRRLMSHPSPRFTPEQGVFVYLSRPISGATRWLSPQGHAVSERRRTHKHRRLIDRRATIQWAYKTQRGRHFFNLFVPRCQVRHVPAGAAPAPRPMGSHQRPRRGKHPPREIPDRHRAIESNEPYAKF